MINKNRPHALETAFQDKIHWGKREAKNDVSVAICIILLMKQK